MFRWTQRKMWQIKIRHPDLWRSTFSRASLRWMEHSLSSGYQYKQEIWLVISSIMLRTLIIRVSSPMPVSDGRDEVSSLTTAAAPPAERLTSELQTMLRKQALAIETFQSKWQMAGQEAHAFIARTRSAVRGLCTCRANRNSSGLRSSLQHQV